MTRVGRLAGILATGLLFVGVPGCGQDNEQAAQITGVAPTGGTTSGPSGYENYAKQQQQQMQNQYKAQGYPGAN